MAEALSRALPAHDFTIVPVVGFDSMRTEVRNGQFEFVLTNPAAYAELRMLYGVQRIATLRNGRTDGGTTQFAGVVFCRRNRSDIRSLADVRGHSLMGVSPEAFGGWWMALRELRDLGIEPRSDCSSLVFSPDVTQVPVVEAVLNGTVDIGTVRTGIIEGLVAKGKLAAGAMKVLGRRDDGFALPHSTRLYPEWPFAATTEVDRGLAKRVAIALLSMQADDPAAVKGGYTGWDTPEDYRMVRDLLQELRVGPYAGYGEVSVMQAMRQHWRPTLAIALLAFALIVLATRLVVVNRRLRNTRNTLREHRDRLEELVGRQTVALAETRDMFETITSQSNEGITIADNDGNYTYVNQAFCDMTGRTAAELLQMTVFDVKAPGQDRHSFDQSKTGNEGVPFEVRLQRKDGSEFMSEVLGKVIEINGEQRVLGIVRDITERIEAERALRDSEEQLRQAQKMESIGRLAGGVAHDFNNMLGVVLGHVEMALEQVDPSQPVHDDLQQIRITTERSADLTRQLLAFARKQTIAPQALDLNRTVAGLLKMVRRIIGEDLELAWQPGPDVWPVKVDPSQIDQVLVNLCVNARDAIDGVGRIMIETANVSFDKAYCEDHIGFLPGDYVQLSVSDTGRGMDKETLARVYEPFFTTKKLGQGTGLGLATVYGIAKQNQGFVNVYSEPGQGTCFKVFLPREGSCPVAPPVRAAEAGSPGGDEVILLVEDEPAILSLTTRILRRLGYTVLAAATPGEALKLAAANADQIALLCTDVVMPEMSGLELAERLDEVCPGARRLFMSGYTANVISHRGILAEGIQFIQKPFTINSLGAKVRQTLDEGR